MGAFFGQRFSIPRVYAPVRRLLHSALTLLVVAALVAPLPAGESAASPVPVCCLGRGEHHCVGQMLGGDSGTPGFSAPNKCPYSPLALAANGPHLAPPPAGQRTIAALEQSTSIVLESNLSVDSFRFATCLQRGPPAFSLN